VIQAITNGARVYQSDCSGLLAAVELEMLVKTAQSEDERTRIVSVITTVILPLVLLASPALMPTVRTGEHSLEYCASIVRLANF
jgi:hypothetical protein